MSKLKRISAMILFVLVIVATLLVATSCGGSIGKAAKVDPATIKYDGEQITWEPAKNAYSYEVKVGDSKYTVSTTSMAYATSLDQLTVEIKSLNKKGKASDAVSMTFNRLGAGVDLTIRFDEEGNASWDAVEGATAYIVDVNGKQEKITSNNYAKENFVQGKRNYIRVRPSSVDNSTFSSWSEKVEKTFLAPPQNIDFDGSRITWKGSSEAEGYEIYIDGSIYDTVEDVSFLTYDSEGKSFTLTMKSVGDGSEVFTSGMSESARFVYLSEITEFRVENGNVSWDEVADAASYNVKIGSRTTNVKEPIIKNLPSGVDNIVSVIPVGANEKGVKYFSSWSAEQKIHIIAAPVTTWNTTLEHNGTPMNSFGWNPVSGVEHYEIRIVHPDLEEEIIVASMYDDTFAYDYLETGRYEISVKAVPTLGDGYYESAYSKPVFVDRLAPPVGKDSGLITSNAQSPEQEFFIHIKSNPAAAGYRVFYEQNELHKLVKDTDIKISDFVNELVTSERVVSFSVRAIAGEMRTMSDGTKYVTLSSLPANDLTFSITLLATPSGLNVEGTILTWDSVTGSFGYKLTGYNSEPSAASFDLSEITSSGTYPIRVFAKGDGHTVLSSKESDAYTVRKLAAPLDLKIFTSGESEGKIGFTEVLGAKSYKIFLGADPTAYDVNEIDNINKFITTNSISIRVAAIADAYDDAQGVYCLSSEKSSPLTVTKLAAPTWGETVHDDKNLIWIGANNISSTTPGYRIYDNKGFVFDGIYAGTKFPLDSFEPGEYTFTVKAIGDGKNTINSEMSEPITVVKLASPELRVNATRTGYEWDRVDGAQRYVVMINGRLVSEVNGEVGMTFGYTLKPEDFGGSIGSFSISVTAVSDSAISSNPTSFTQVTKYLSAPTFTVGYSHECFDPAGYITVTATATDTHTQGYVFVHDGVTSEPQSIENNTYQILTANSGTYTANAVAVGQVLGEGTVGDAIYYLNSQQGTNKTVRILGKPGVGGVSINQYGKLSWTAVNGAILGYKVTVRLQDAAGTVYSVDVTNGQTNYTFKTSEYPLFDINMVGTYKFEIQAIGNMNNLLVASEPLIWDQSMQAN